MVSIVEIHRRQKTAQKAANNLFKKVKQRESKVDKKCSDLPNLTRAMVQIYNGLLLWCCEVYPDEML